MVDGIAMGLDGWSGLFLCLVWTRSTRPVHGGFVPLIFALSRSEPPEPRMADPITLTTLLLGAAAACGTAVVEEVTKDAYARLKEKVGALFGPRAVKAVAKLDDETTRDEGRQELERYVGDQLEPHEAEELAPLVEALVRALQCDKAASQAVHARIGLDLDVGGDALLRNIQGAREIVVKAKAAGDFTLEDVKMDTGREPGK